MSSKLEFRISNKDEINTKEIKEKIASAISKLLDFVRSLDNLSKDNVNNSDFINYIEDIRSKYNNIQKDKSNRFSITLSDKVAREILLFTREYSRLLKEEIRASEARNIIINIAVDPNVPWPNHLRK